LFQIRTRPHPQPPAIVLPQELRQRPGPVSALELDEERLEAADLLDVLEVGALALVIERVDALLITERPASPTAHDGRARNASPSGDVAFARNQTCATSPLGLG